MITFCNKEVLSNEEIPYSLGLYQRIKNLITKYRERTKSEKDGGAEVEGGDRWRTRKGEKDTVVKALVEEAVVDCICVLGREKQKSGGLCVGGVALEENGGGDDSRQNLLTIDTPKKDSLQWGTRAKETST
ncbi:hypothetical protein L2E82_47299 [Cichorium intybus]|uniref:Uncharacterized protein n=1 Tax=Cichorium intybus TaxID=13427 RepID=A0ACB8YV43_CICIN|nr:hypothetical protein L2E82_47299 [Cichorium intybus]